VPTQGYEEVRVPAIKTKPPHVDLVKVENMEPFAQKAFEGYETLNRIQSKIYQTGFYSNENMLVRHESAASPLGETLDSPAADI
jgi:activating signal cointegrator complex subunit 3